MADPELLLRSAITFHEADRRTAAVPQTFDTAEDAISVWQNVLLHEAREDMSAPLDARPECAYLHPIDVDTDEPGIVADRTKLNILRRRSDSLARLRYKANDHPPDDHRPDPPPTPIVATPAAAAKRAGVTRDRAIGRAERLARDTVRVQPSPG